MVAVFTVTNKGINVNNKHGKFDGFKTGVCFCAEYPQVHLFSAILFLISLLSTILVEFYSITILPQQYYIAEKITI